MVKPMYNIHTQFTCYKMEYMEYQRAIIPEDLLLNIWYPFLWKTRRAFERLSSFHRVPNNSNGRGLCLPADPLDSIPRAFWQSRIILEYSLSLATRLRKFGKIPAEPAGPGGYVTHLYHCQFSHRDPRKRENGRQTIIKTRKMKRKSKIVSYVSHCRVLNLS